MTIQQQPPEALERSPAKASSEALEQERWPLIEVFSEAGKLVVTADLPGVTAEDVTVGISEQEIRLHGERRRASDGRDREYFEQEQRFGGFERVIKLQKRVKPQPLTARIESGVLTLELEPAGE